MPEQILMKLDDYGPLYGDNRNFSDKGYHFNKHQESSDYVCLGYLPLIEALNLASEQVASRIPIRSRKKTFYFLVDSDMGLLIQWKYVP